MDLDHETVGSHRQGRLGQGLHVSPDAGGVAGVYDDGQMALGPDHGNGADVQGVAGAGLKGADAPLTQDDVRVAFRYNVLGRVEPLVDGGGQASF